MGHVNIGGTEMHVVILAAGQSRRFQEAGYYTPKPFIQILWRGQTMTMLEHVLNTVPWSFTDITVAIPPGWKSTAEKIDPKTRKVRFIEIEDSIGPADTARRVVHEIKATDGCLFMDADVLNHTNDLYRLSYSGTAAVLVNRSDNSNSSYVDNLGTFKQIKEKQRISEYAVQGAYFVPVNMMPEFTLWLKKVVHAKEEPYLSHAFDMIMFEKLALMVTYNPIEWGTPHDIRKSDATIITKMED
jgi:NDP-sugar pyrophosphorylase family protein